MDLKDFIFETIAEVGVIGFEQKRGLFLKEKFSHFCDEVNIDTLGNVIALKKGKNPSKGKIMYIAHMDEIGLIISNIDDKGLITVTGIGYDQRTLVAQEVVIYGKELVKGVFGVAPPHLTTPEDEKKATKINEMKIDTGLTVEKVRELISIGDVVVVKREPVELLNDRISSRALDDISCVGVMYETMKKIQNFNHDVDVYFVASVQEEMTSNGAYTATRAINPDIAIVLDVNFAKTPELSKVHIELGKGPAIEVTPNTHRQVLKHIKKVAGENGIEYQINISTSVLGTDAAAVSISNYGVATIDVGVPLRYMHTSIETLDMKDVKNTARLMTSFIESFNDVEDMEAFLCY